MKVAELMRTDVKVIGPDATVAEAVELLVEQGYDPVYGARPLKRVIQRNIENPLATELLAGRYAPGTTIVVGVSGERYTFTPKAG